MSDHIITRKIQALSFDAAMETTIYCGKGCRDNLQGRRGTWPHQSLVGGEPSLQLQLQSDIVQGLFGQDMQPVRRVRCLHEHINLATEGTMACTRVPWCGPGTQACIRFKTSLLLQRGVIVLFETMQALEKHGKQDTETALRWGKWKTPERTQSAAILSKSNMTSGTETIPK